MVALKFAASHGATTELRVVFSRRNSSPSEKLPKQLWWPTPTASDRQLVTVGQPFFRKGEKLLVEETSGGSFKSRAIV